MAELYVTVPHGPRATFLKTARVTLRLYSLLCYAHTHAHSRQWIGAIATLLEKGSRAHG